MLCGFVFIEKVCVCRSILHASGLFPINKPEKKENYSHLTGLELADNTDGQSELKIDILIGMDYYFSFLTGKKRQGVSGPVAMESVIGWIFGGESYKAPP